jgi:hypothetical protein
MAPGFPAAVSMGMKTRRASGSPCAILLGFIALKLTDIGKGFEYLLLNRKPAAKDSVYPGDMGNTILDGEKKCLAIQ